MSDNQILNIYESGRVIRYHANYRFHHLQQNNADHQWGATALLLVLHPDPTVRLITKVHFHDGGELKAGDLPYPFKIAHPEFATEHARVEFALAAEAGIPGAQDVLDEEDTKWLTLVDRLESFLLAKFYRPDVLNEPSWVKQTAAIMQMSEELGCYHKLKEILHV